MVRGIGSGVLVSIILDGAGRLIARYLQKPVRGYEPFTPSDPDALRQTLEPGDVLACRRQQPRLRRHQISHAIDLVAFGALCRADAPGATRPEDEPHVLIEANLGEGVVSAPLSKDECFHTRICRPVGLTAEDRAVVCAYAIARLGFAYDLKNIIDLMRYLLPLPVPRSVPPPHDRARLGRSDAADLLGTDRGCLPRGALSDPAEDGADRKPLRPARKSWRSGTPRFIARAISTFRPISKW